jgi:hypothetical protein
VQLLSFRLEKILVIIKDIANSIKDMIDIKFSNEIVTKQVLLLLIFFVINFHSTFVIERIEIMNEITNKESKI